MGLLTTLAGAKYKIIAGVAVAAALAFAGGMLYNTGLSKGKSQAALAISEYQRKISELQNKVTEAEGKVTERVVTEYVDRVITRDRIVYKNKEIIVEKVPETFLLTKGWVYAHNQSALGNPIDPALAENSEESSISDRDGLEVIANNNAICLANTEQLEALQTWVKEIKEARDEAVTRTK